MDLEACTESKINFVPCVKWVKRGVAKANPDKVELTKEELIHLINDAKNKLSMTAGNDDEEDESNENAETPENENDEFNMANYDEDNDEDVALQQLGIQAIAELPDAQEEEEEDDDADSEKEDDIIKPDDNLIIVGRVDGDASILEIYVHNESEGSLYCHHDFLLPSFPLCFEWLDFEPESPHGNFCAIGSMTAEINVWDLDLMNCIEPAYVLGCQGSRRKGIKHIGHRDAVLDLAWNRNYHHILASCSVDKRIILWDIESKTPNTTIEVFADKVQCIKWKVEEGHTLLAGGCDKTARLLDGRNTEEHKIWNLSGEAEQMLWSPSNSNMFIVGTDNGVLESYDIRKGQIWSKKVHDKEITGLAFSAQCPGLLTSVSPDTCLKVWDYNDLIAPELVYEKDLKMGILHTLDYCPDSPFLIAAGGDNKTYNFSVINLLNYDPVKHTFSTRPLKSTTSNIEMEVGE